MTQRQAAPVNMPWLTVKKLLVLISCIFMVLPLGGIYFLHIYENALLHQTESELISQAALVSSLYKNNVQQIIKQNPNTHYGITLTNTPPELKAILPHLDLGNSKVYPPRPTGKTTKNKSDNIAIRAGKEIEPVLQEAKKLTLSGIKVLDYKGIVVTGNEKGLSFKDVPEFIAAISGQPVMMLRKRITANPAPALNSISRGSKVNVFMAFPIILKNRLIGIVWLNRTPPDILQTIYGKRWQMFWTVLLLIGLTSLITVLSGMTITQPIRKLVEQTRLIASGKKMIIEPITNPVTREVAILSKSIAAMANKINDRNDYIRNFTTHISHEFKTPLTSMQGSIELLLDDWEKMPEKQRQQFLQNIADDTSHLKQLVFRLLELARADASEVAAQPSNIMQITTTVIEHFTKKGLHIKLDNRLSKHSTLVNIDNESLEAVFCNLMENSLQAQAKTINITLEQKGQNVLVNIQDDGAGISKANQALIFTPFFTTKRKNGGTGLGLSIVQSLLEKQQASISIQNVDTGCCFQIALKAVAT